MLISFKVGNFLSFDQVQTFSMEAGKVRNYKERLHNNKNRKLLKFAAIYGANASGKSNLVESMNFFQTLVLEGIPNKSTQSYCKVKDDNKIKNTDFEITIETNGRILSYGISLNLFSKSFTREYLLDKTKDKNGETIFNRNIVNDSYVINLKTNNKKLDDRIAIYADDIKSDNSILFLQAMNKNKQGLYSDYSEVKELDVFKKVYRWIKYKLSVNHADIPITGYSSLIESDNFEVIGELLSKFGTGVTNLEMKEVSIEEISTEIPQNLMQDIISTLEKDIKKRNDDDSIIASVLLRGGRKSMYVFEMDNDTNIECKTIQFTHNNSYQKYSIAEESDGTVRLLDLIEVLLAGDDDIVFVVDEINRCLHPHLTYEFIKQYLKKAETRKIQLIVTTHESKLMDFDLLRKDEIWFVNKDEYGVSELYSLEKYNERFDKKILRAYFNGEYDAIPKFDFEHQN